MGAKVKKPRQNAEQTAETEALFMSIGDGVIVTDSRARISRINQAAIDILGYKEKKELLGHWLPGTIIADDENGKLLSNYNRPISQVFLTGKSVASRAFYRRKDGSRVPVSLTVSPVLVNSRPVGAIEVFRDISQEIALEQAKDEFVAIASHQLRTPATAVKQYIGLLLEGYAEPLSDNQKMFLERAYESNERQLRIVQEILRVTQLDLNKVILRAELYDLIQIVEEAIESVRSKLDKKKQKVIFSRPKQSIRLNGDKEQIRVAIENLLENASNYSWKGKKIEIQIRSYKDTVRICIIDEGVGIDPKDQQKLFQKFSRVPNALSIEVGGTGLGLYWADRIVNLHGGQIRVESSANKGSKFKVILPKDS